MFCVVHRAGLGLNLKYSAVKITLKYQEITEYSRSPSGIQQNPRVFLKNSFISLRTPYNHLLKNWLIILHLHIDTCAIVFTESSIISKWGPPGSQYRFIRLCGAWNFKSNRCVPRGESNTLLTASSHGSGFFLLTRSLTRFSPLGANTVESKASLHWY